MGDRSHVLYAKVLTKYDSTKLDQFFFVQCRWKHPRGLKIQIDSSEKLRTREAKIDLLQKMT